ncbi:MAG: DUF4870 domain-containing protein [Lachnospiraceae bacterium]|nr:DUF4870 domain-containing protein [Lachnospiraceae bacterium]
MDKKVTSIVAYGGILTSLFGFLSGPGKLGMFIPLIIWFIAYNVGDKKGAKLHLNQSLILIILGLACSIVCWILGIIPIIKIFVGIIDLIVKVITLIFGVWGMITAINGDNKKLPIIGDVPILK